MNPAPVKSAICDRLQYIIPSGAIPALFVLLFLPLLLCSSAIANFYYYNPDSANSNLANLKQSMDVFLKDEGFSFTFQPFSRLIDFERQIKEKQPALLFLPEWYLKQDGNAQKYKPLLIPLNHGQTTYRKVLLIGANSSLTTDKLANVMIAMTPVGQAGMNQLNEAIFKDSGLDANNLQFVTTVKDADALFALALGQVPAALVAQNTIDQVGKLSPQIINNIKQVAVSAPLPMPLLCYVEGAIESNEVRKIREILLKGKQDKNVAQLMEVLGIDGWQDIVAQ